MLGEYCGGEESGVRTGPGHVTGHCTGEGARSFRGRAVRAGRGSRAPWSNAGASDGARRELDRLAQASRLGTLPAVGPSGRLAPRLGCVLHTLTGQALPHGCRRHQGRRPRVHRALRSPDGERAEGTGALTQRAGCKSHCLGLFPHLRNSPQSTQLLH